MERFRDLYKLTCAEPGALERALERQKRNGVPANGVDLLALLHDFNDFCERAREMVAAAKQEDHPDVASVLKRACDMRLNETFEDWLVSASAFA